MFIVHMYAMLFTTNKNYNLINTMANVNYTTIVHNKNMYVHILIIIITALMPHNMIQVT